MSQFRTKIHRQRLSNNRFIKPFEELTRLWGLPHYDEMDPTPIIAITFPIIFGLMFGDIGHGLILLVGGLTLGIMIKKNQAIKNVSWIMAACGAAAITAGALYGEFFGKELFAPLWFSPFNNVFDFLIFALVIGVIQITSGLVLEMVDFLLKHNVIDAVLTAMPKIAFYLGGVTLIVVYKLNLGVWFSGPILLIIVPFIILGFCQTYFFCSEKFFNECQLGEEPAENARLLGRGFSRAETWLLVCLATRFLTREFSLCLWLTGHYFL